MPPAPFTTGNMSALSLSDPAELATPRKSENGDDMVKNRGVPSFHNQKEEEAPVGEAPPSPTGHQIFSAARMVELAATKGFAKTSMASHS